MKKHHLLAGKIWACCIVGTGFLSFLPPVHAGPPPGTGQWTLTFNEDFNGPTLDTTKWSTGMRWGGWINHEQQAYRPECVTFVQDPVEGGVCRLKMEKLPPVGAINHAGTYPTGTTTVNVDGVTGAFANGEIIYIDMPDFTTVPSGRGSGGTNEGLFPRRFYKVISSVGGSTPTQVVIQQLDKDRNPVSGGGLDNAVSDNTAVYRTTKIQDMYGQESLCFVYKSGVIQSYNKWTQKYGYFEARVKMPDGKGTWPAFWMIPERGPTVTDITQRTGVGTRGGLQPMGNEIDIFEYLGNWQKTLDNLSLIHGGYFWGYDDNVDDSWGRYADDTVIPNPALGYGAIADPNHTFHTYGLYWAPGLYIWYVDGVPVMKREDPTTISASPEQILFCLAMSTNPWFGPQLTTVGIEAGLPASMDIAYFRAYSGTAPAPNSGDIGAVGLSGSNSVASSTGIYTLTAAGADIGGTTDAFQFKSRPVSGDFTAVAKVASLTNTHVQAKAGLMVRQNIDDTASPNISMLIPAAAPATFQYRSASGGATTAINMVGGSTATVTDGFTDGGRSNGADVLDTAWYMMGTPTVAVVDDSAGIGVGNALEITSTSTGRGLVAVMPPRTLADGESLSLSFKWRFTGTAGLNQSRNLRFGMHSSNGTPTTADSTTSSDNDKGYFATTNPGLSDVGGTAIYREDGNSPGVLGGTDWAVFGTNGASLNAGTTTHTASLTLKRVGNTMQVTSVIDNLAAATGTHNTPITYTFDQLAITLAGASIPSPIRIDDVSVSYGTGSGPASLPGWVKLNRTGNVFTGSWSADGTNWTQVGSQTIALPSSLFLGLAATSHTTAVTTTATFSDVKTDPFLKSEDLGQVALATSVSEAAGVYTVQASGYTFGGDVDNGGMLTQTLIGDGSITARVSSMSNIYSAVAGVMVREVDPMFGPNSEGKMAAVTIARQGRLVFRYRASDYIPAVAVDSGLGTGFHPAYWVRLVRAGDVFTGYGSSDGVTWNLISSQNISLPKEVKIGLIVNATNIVGTPALVTAVIDNITINGKRGL